MGTAMHMIYNSPNFCVVEFKAEQGPEPRRFAGGFEIMDKHTRREIFIDGEVAARFRADVQELIASEPSIEEVDEFLSQFQVMMQHPMTLH
ncbi:MAG: DUF3567 domain-containing protein [Burkholderiales bacterium]|nr:MAG: DUF3567 domain-containing protein [Burkholderiales bacterium]